MASNSGIQHVDKAEAPTATAPRISTAASSTAADPKAALPEPFFTFFTVIEPLLTVAGGVYAAFFSEDYHVHSLPTPWFPPVTLPIHPSTFQSLHLLGNLYFLLAAMSFFFLPALVRHPRIALEDKQSLVMRFFIILSVADWTHIIWSFWDLGDEVAFYPVTRWSESSLASLRVPVKALTTKASQIHWPWETFSSQSSCFSGDALIWP